MRRERRVKRPAAEAVPEVQPGAERQRELAAPAPQRDLNPPPLQRGATDTRMLPRNSPVEHAKFVTSDRNSAQVSNNSGQNPAFRLLVSPGVKLW